MIVIWCLVAKSCPTLLQPHDCSLPGSSIHGISQARIVEWLPFPSPRDLLDPGIEPTSPALAGRLFTTEPPGKPDESKDLEPQMWRDHLEES